jgi:Zinc knuckle
MQHHLKEIVVEDVVATPEEIVDVVAIMFDDVKVIISNQMTTIWGDMKKKRIHHLLKKSKSSCYRCGMTNHWSRICRTPKHLVKLYQASIKKKRKEIEINFIENESSGILMDTHLDIFDFFENVDKEIDIMN